MGNDLAELSEAKALWRALKGRHLLRPHLSARRENWDGSAATQLRKGSTQSRTAGLELGKPEIKTKGSQFTWDQLREKVTSPTLHDLHPRLSIFVQFCSALNRGQQTSSLTRNGHDTCAWGRGGTHGHVDEDVCAHGTRAAPLHS